MTNNQVVLTESEKYRQLQKAHWAFRSWMTARDLWPTPGTPDAASYSIQEVGASLDAEMRILQTEHKRNTDRSPTVLNELADTWFMISTMYGEGYFMELDEDVDRTASLKAIAYYATSAAYSEERSLPWRQDAELAANLIVQYFTENADDDNDLIKTVKERFWRILWKRLSEANIAASQGINIINEIEGILSASSAG